MTRNRLALARVRRRHGGMLLLCAVLMQGAVAQQTVTTTYGLDVEIPNTTIELKWLKTETKEFYPNQNEYEADVETLLKSPPMCLDTGTYCRTTESSEREINLGDRMERGRSSAEQDTAPARGSKGSGELGATAENPTGPADHAGNDDGGSFGGSTEVLGTGGTSTGGTY